MSFEDNDATVDDGELSIDDMLQSDDPTLVAMAQELQGGAAMAEPNAEPNAEPTEEDTPNPDDESADKPDATQSGEEEEAGSEAAETAQSDKPADEEEAPIDGVLTRDGKRVIPFSELESARQRAQSAEAQNRELEQRINDTNETLEKFKRQFALAEKKGVELPTLPEDEQITDEMINELEDISPEMAVIARKFNHVLEQQAQASTPAANATTDDNAGQPDVMGEPTQQQVTDAINGNLAMREIINNEQMFAIAKHVEASLANDPNYESLDVRYAETVKRVGGALGIDFAAKYDPSVIGQKAEPPTPPAEPGVSTKSKPKAPDINTDLPQSVSEIPTSSDTSGKSTEQILADQNPDALHDSLENMNAKQIESLLFQAN